MIGALIGDKHTYKDFGLKMTALDISPPNQKRMGVQILGLDGELDLSTALTGGMMFENREISMTFELEDEDFFRWSNIKSELMDYMHGKHFKIILDTDKNFFYRGYVTVDSQKVERQESQIALIVDAEPYKYDRFSSLEEWEWSPFNFRNGIIQKFVDLKVDGRLDLIIISRRKQSMPEFYADADMGVVFEGLHYSINANKKTALTISLKEGENHITIVGVGTISVEYRGGSL